MSDVSVSQQVNAVPINSIGLQKILVPLRKTEINADNLQKVLPQIMNIFAFNSNKARQEYEYYKGAHSVLSKKRPYDDESNVNNIIVEPHLWAMVNFKCGYAYGQPIEFAKRTTDDSNEMNTLHNYINSVDFDGVIDSVAEWVYTTGVGYTFTQPRKSDDPDYIAPFETYHIESDKCAKIYSSYIGNEPLFDIIVTPISKYALNNVVDYWIVSIYTEDMYYEFETPRQGNMVFNLNTDKTQKRSYKLLPLVEYYAYNSRVGIVESCQTMQDALDRIDSNGVDNIEETVNQMLIIKNCLLGANDEEKKTKLKNARKNGVLEIFDGNEKMPADVKTLITQLNHADINILKTQLISYMYGCWGVPLAISGMKSGNITQGGGEISNGWENAYSLILKENNKVKLGIKNWLRQILWICRAMPQSSNVKTIKDGDIEIKYNIARSNNLLTKTQSYAYLVDRSVPPDIALAICELSSDPHSTGKIIEDSVREKEEEARELEQQKLATSLAQKSNNSFNNTSTPSSTDEGM